MVHVLLYLSRIEILHVSLRHNVAGPQNNVPSESSFATKSALFCQKNVCPFQILDLTLGMHTQLIKPFNMTPRSMSFVLDFCAKNSFSELSHCRGHSVSQTHVFLWNTAPCRQSYHIRHAKRDILRNTVYVEIFAVYESALFTRLSSDCKCKYQLNLI